MNAATDSAALVRTFEQMPDIDVVHRYRKGLEAFDPRLFDLSDVQLDTAFLPEAGVGRWPIRVLLGHLADAEVVFTHRMRRAVAEDSPVLAPFDEDAFIDAGLYGGPEGGGAHPIAGFITVIHTLRRWTSGWLLTLLPDQFQRAAMHPQRGPQSVKAILAYTTWHLEHHAEFCNRKVCKMLGPRPIDDDAPRPAGGGCGPGCGCRPKA